MARINKGLIAGVLAVGSFAVAPQASAITLVAGDYRLSFVGEDDATSGYPVGSPACSTVAECDAVATRPAQFGIGSEDTWGVARLPVITVDGAPFFQGGDNGEYLTAIFYGLADQVVARETVFGGAEETQTFSVGGQLDIYLDTVDNFDSSPGPQARTALDQYPGATDGSLFLSLAFTPVANPVVATSTLAGSFNSGSVAGSSVAYLDVIGGSAASFFDTNEELDLAGNFHDFTINVGFQCSAASVGVDCDPTNSDPSLFSVLITGDLVGAVNAAQVPVPASLGLVATAFGLFAARRRRRRAKA